MLTDETGEPMDERRGHQSAYERTKRHLFFKNLAAHRQPRELSDFALCSVKRRTKNAW